MEKKEKGRKEKLRMRKKKRMKEKVGMRENGEERKK